MWGGIVCFWKGGFENFGFYFLQLFRKTSTFCLCWLSFIGTSYFNLGEWKVGQGQGDCFSVFSIQTPGTALMWFSWVPAGAWRSLLKVCQLKLRVIKITCALHDVCSVWLARGSLNSKGQQKYDLWSSVQKPWGCWSLFYFNFICFTNWKIYLRALPWFQTSKLGGCRGSSRDIISSG